MVRRRGEPGAGIAARTRRRCDRSTRTATGIPMGKERQTITTSRSPRLQVQAKAAVVEPVVRRRCRMRLTRCRQMMGDARSLRLRPRHGPHRFPYKATTSATRSVY